MRYERGDMDIHVEGVDPNTENYDERGLVACRCSCGRKFPSKKMFADFLKRYDDIDAEAVIVSIENRDVDSETVTIYVEVTYSIAES